MRRAVVLVTTVLFAIVGPRLLSPQDRSAGRPFGYVPPDGFVARPSPEGSSADAKLWVFAASEGASFVPRVVVTHSSLGGTVEGEDLGRLASGMPKVFSDSGISWALRRQETRTRADGARVGVLEGDCVRALPVETRYRVLQLVFPDDQGSSIATASYPAEEANRWEPLFEASIARAEGVAVRVPPPPAWLYVASGVAGLVLGALTVALVARRRPARDGDAASSE